MTSVTAYVEGGGGRALARARELGPGGTVQEVQLSGLRGRGGAGFPTGRKWQSVRDSAGPEQDRYVVCNGAEGEPGTFKDRAIMRANPYQVIEGVAIAALTMAAKQAFIGLKASFAVELDRLERALTEMEAEGLAGDVPITLVSGPDEYLYGEETGLLQVIEGDAPLPRLVPPYLHGLFATGPEVGWSAGPRVGGGGGGHPPTEFASSNPTLVNNVETLATVGHILARGPEWHRSLGTPQSAGLAVCTVVGDVARAGVAEVEMGTPLRVVIDRVGGGVRPGRTIKAVLSGVANPVLTAAELDTPVSYEAMESVGSGLGSCGFIVYDDTTSAVELARVVSRFLYVESCGQCPACKLGTGAITDQVDALLSGGADGDEIDVVAARLRSVTDGNRCYLPVQEQRVVASLLRAFPEEFLAAQDGRPPSRRGLQIAKLVEVTYGQAIYDELQARKQPDWTYED
ncbi:MAG: NADH-ubiquinone oxidoreductase-F iron-sulfur binding region domain-containing protein [Acidimicrobiales bacterium]